MSASSLEDEISSFIVFKSLFFLLFFFFGKYFVKHNVQVTYDTLLISGFPCL